MPLFLDIYFSHNSNYDNNYYHNFYYNHRINVINSEHFNWINRIDCYDDHWADHYLLLRRPAFKLRLIGCTLWTISRRCFSDELLS